MKIRKRLLAFLSAFLIGFGLFGGLLPTVAAADQMTIYLVDLPRAVEPNKTGWGNPAMQFLGGWEESALNKFCVYAQDGYFGKVVYCIEPGVTVRTGNSYQSRDENFWDSYPAHLNPTIGPSTIKQLLGRVMTYGWQGNANPNWITTNTAVVNDLAGYIATQLLVWEVVVGERDAQFCHIDARAQGKNNIAEYISAQHPLRNQIFSQYAAIESAVQRHTLLPSFCSSSADAAAYELKWDGSKYALTLTDTNQVLGGYTFSGNAGLNFSVSGNQLTITSTQPINSPVTVKAEKANSQRSGIVVWTDGLTHGGTQDFATYGAAVSDPVEGYLRLETNTGDMKLIKTSEDGKVDGIVFTITGEGYNANKTTNAAGEIELLHLDPGIYTVTEQPLDPYEPQSSKRVTVVNGGTATVTFNNKLKRGNLEITKTSEDGLIEGVTFRLSGTSLSGLPVEEYAVTGGDGIARFEGIPIGSDYLLEEVDTPARYLLPEPQSVSIDWNEVTQKSVHNQLKKFRVTVTKSDAQTGIAQGDGSLAGAVYGLYQGSTLVDSYTTDANGQFITEYYPCGTDWTIREISPSEGYLLDPTVHKVGADPNLYTVEQNEIALDLTEQVIQGKIAILKHTDDGNTQTEIPEVGAEFEVYRKEAGSYEDAKESERDVLTCDENGYAESKQLPYGTYIVHQTKSWEGREWMEDFEVVIARDGEIYRYLINNAAFRSYLKVVKTDAETGAVIPYAGAGFEIYRPDGSKVEMTFNYPTPSTIDTFYTNEEGYLITPEMLGYGSGYSLVEVQAPHGYVLDSTPVFFDVAEEASSDQEGMTVIEVTKSDTAQKGIIKINKTGEILSSVVEQDGIYQPVYDETGLAGAVFEITALEDVFTPDGTLRYAVGELVDTITTGEDGTAESKPLYLGKYQLEETTIPYGMVDSGEPVTVELTYAGQQVAVTETSVNLSNQRQKVQVLLTKLLEQDETFGVSGALSAVTFGLYAQEEIVAADGSTIPADGLLGNISVEENGEASIDLDLPFGKFYLKELSTDQSHLLSEEKFPFAFAYSGPEEAVVTIQIEDITNELIRGEIRGIKTDEDGNGLAGALIGLFRPEEELFIEESAIATTTSAEDGSFAFSGVPYGDWVVREIESPEGLVLSEESVPVSITGDEQIVEISMTNTPIRGSLRLVKLDQDFPDRRLSGAEFSVYRDTNGNKELDDQDPLLGVMVELSDGIYTMSNIRYGGILVKETKAPEGYLPDENAYYLEITENGKVYEVENKDGTGFVNAPQTGTLRIQKTSDDGKVAGISFRVTGPDGYVQIFQTDENGIIEIQGLRVGEYTVSEVSNSASAGYLLPPDETVRACLNETAVVQMHNKLRDDNVGIPNTGDTSNPWPWITLMSVSSAGAIISGITAYIIKRKKGEKSSVSNIS